MSNRRFERIFGRTRVTEPEAQNVEPVPALDPPRQVYEQWYDRDEALFHEECSLLQASGMLFDSRRLADGRISFSGRVADREVAIICSHHHPIVPAEAYIIDGNEIVSIMADDGRIDLFAHEGFMWTTETHVVDVVNWLKTLLSIAGSKDTPSPAATPGKHSNNDVYHDAIVPNLPEVVPATAVLEHPDSRCNRGAKNKQSEHTRRG